MNSESTIDALLQQTMVLVARLATQDGARLSLAHVTETAFAELNRELQRQGVTTRVIADMLGMAPRTYHRHVEAARQAGPGQRRTVSQEVLELMRLRQPVSGHQIKQHFSHESHDLICSVLRDLVHSRLARRSGWGETALYRVSAQAELLLAGLALGSGQPVGEVAIAAQTG